MILPRIYVSRSTSRDFPKKSGRGPRPFLQSGPAPYICGSGPERRAVGRLQGFDRLDELRKIDRLHEVTLESGLPGGPHVALGSEPGESNAQDRIPGEEA